MRYATLLALAGALAAQDVQFDARSRLVLVPVAVTDAKGQPVNGLEPGEFQVLDNGKPRKATVDTMDTGVAPIALVIAAQTSGISNAALERVRKIGSMIQPVITGERGCAALMSFADRVTWIRECMSDVGTGFRELQPTDPTAADNRKACMLDAVHEGITYLSRRTGVRRVLLLISESRDRGSEVALEAVAAEAQSAGVTIYSITYSATKTAFLSKLPVAVYVRPRNRTPLEAAGRNQDGSVPTRDHPSVPPPEHRVDLLAGMEEFSRLLKMNTTQALAETSGGAVYQFTTLNGLEEAINKLGGELHSQYVLSFIPDTEPTGYHALEVKVLRPGSYSIRARRGYWQAEEPPSQPQTAR